MNTHNADDFEAKSKPVAVVHPGELFRGTLRLPGDKSLAHRALIFAALSDGTCSIENLPQGQDVWSTLNALRLLGVPIEQTGTTAVVQGVSGRFATPDRPIDCGNSGTTIRLLAGLLAGAGISATLTGDASLCARPMGRLIDPLAQMGSKILGTSDKRTAPIVLEGPVTTPIEFTTQVASAQVKTAILLAGLFLTGRTRVIEPAKSRDHTQRMLAACGVPVVAEDSGVSVMGPALPRAFDIVLPGDISSAAFFAAGAACRLGSEVRFESLLINPTRWGFFAALQKAQVEVRIENETKVLGEPVADVVVRSTNAAKALSIFGSDAVAAIDELPLFGVMGAFAQSKTSVRDAAELRVKETDRIAAVCQNLKALGIETTEHPDGFDVSPGVPLPGTVDSFGDHRIAMAFAIAGAVGAKVRIKNADAASVSYPQFFDHLGALCLGCKIEWETE